MINVYKKKNINVEFGGAIIISYVHSLWQDGHFNGVYMLNLHTNSLYRRMRDMGKKSARYGIVSICVEMC